MSDFTVARRRMVDCQVRPSDVTDLRIIEAMLDVPREVFVPEHLKPLAYLDQDLKVGSAGEAPRYLIRPGLLARLLQAAAITAAEKVLVVGCASGYPAAVAAKLAATVVATEPVPALVAQTQGALAQLGIVNATVKQAAARDGSSAEAPFDVILLHGTSQVGLEGLRAQLAVGGRMVGISAMGGTDRAILVTRSAADFGDRVLFDAAAPVLSGLERPAAFVF